MKTENRTSKVKKSIISLGMVKGYNVVINLLLLPITLAILDNYKYGVWITIFNMLMWIEVFDLGLGNSLRNKFSEAKTKGNNIECREYISTAYITMLLTSFFLILLFFVLWHFIDWSYVFNTSENLAEEVTNLMGVIAFSTILLFTFKLINAILLADHKPALSALLFSISNTIIYVILLVFKDLLKGSLIGIGFVYTLTPLLVFILLSSWFFSHSYKNFTPSFKFFKKSKIHELFSLGSYFFVIQITALIIFQTDALIISHVLSPAVVTSYNIVFKYFSIVLIFNTLIMTPLWSAYTEAYTNGDIKWIKTVLYKQLIGTLFFTPILVLMIMFGKKIINLWINKQDVFISISLLVAFGVYTLVSILSGITSTILGGISKVKVIMIVNVFTMIINIPLSIYLIRFFNNQSFGVIVATTICLLISLIVNVFQVKHYIFVSKR